MTRQLTVLGGCGAYPEPGRACSGFLVEWDDFRLVLDLGYATFPRLLAHRPAADIDALVITHEHPDHCVDVHGLFRMRLYGGAGRKLPLYCTPGVLTRLAGLEPEADLRAVFDVHELPGTYQVGPFQLSSILLPHYVPNVGIRLQAGPTSLAYTGDTGPDPLLADLGRDAELYIMDATDRDGETRQPQRNLLTSEEAGYWATQAGARKLMLSHFWPGNDRSAAASAARRAFPGDVLTADEDVVVPLGRGVP